MLKRLIASVSAALLWITPVYADSQGAVTPGTAATRSTLTGCVYNSSTPTLTNGQQASCQFDSSGNLKIGGTISATTTGFAPGASYTTLTSTGSSARHALPTGTVVIAYNTGTTAVSCVLGNSSVTAVANEDQIQPGSWVAYTVGSNADLACINQAGDSASNVVVMSGGSGLPTGSGGGSSSGGGGGAVYGPTAVGSPAANPPVLAGGTADGTATGNVGVLKIVSGVGSANTAQVNGVTTLTGTGATGTGAQRVTVSEDTNTIAGSAVGTAGSASTNVLTVQGIASGTAVAVTSGVAQGSTTSGQTLSPIGCRTLSSAPTDTTAQSNIPRCTPSGSLVTEGLGTAGTAAGGVYSVQGVASMTPVQVGGGIAQGSTTSGQSLLPVGVATLSSLPTNTTAQTNMPIADINGGLVTVPYAPTGSAARGTGVATASTSGITMLAASGSASLYEYITDVECGRTDAGTTASYVTFNDSASSIMVIPDGGGGGGNNQHYSIPLRVAKNTAATFTSSASLSSVYCNAQGYYGP